MRHHGRSVSATAASTTGTGSGWPPRDRIAAIGDDSAAAGHRASAREAYYRACNYYRSSYFPLYGAPTDPRLVEAFDKETAIFLKGAALSDIPIEAVEIPFEDRTLPAYFVTVDDSGDAAADHRPHQRLRLHHPGDVLRPRAGGHPPRLQHPPLRWSRPGPQSDQGRHPHPPGLGERRAPGHRLRPHPAGDRPGQDRPGRLEFRRLPGAPRGVVRASHRRPGRRSRPVGRGPGRSWPGSRSRTSKRRPSPTSIPRCSTPFEEWLRGPDAPSMLRWSLIQRGLWVNGVDSLYDYAVDMFRYELSSVAKNIACPTFLSQADGRSRRRLCPRALRGHHRAQGPCRPSPWRKAPACTPRPWPAPSTISGCSTGWTRRWARHNFLQDTVAAPERPRSHGHDDHGSAVVLPMPAMTYEVASGVAAAEPFNAGWKTWIRLLPSSETKTSPASLTAR